MTEAIHLSCGLIPHMHIGNDLTENQKVDFFSVYFSRQVWILKSVSVCTYPDKIYIGVSYRPLHIFLYVLCTFRAVGVA